MGNDTFRLPSLYLRHITEQVSQRGVDAVRLWTRFGFPSALLSEAEVELSLPELRMLAEAAIEATNEPALGLFVGERIGAHAHGIPGITALASGTLGQALDALERFLPLRVPMLRITQTRTETGHRIAYSATRPLGSIEAPFFELVLVALKNLLDTLSRGSSERVLVSFEMKKPAHAALARDVFGCEVRYGQPFTGFVLPLALLERDLELADPRAFEEAERICERELEKLHADPSTSARVQRLLFERPSGFPSLAVAARRLGVSQRTLHRRLVAEGTSFHALRDEVRCTLAKEHLPAGHGGVKEIAYLLGYSEVSAFRRAFKRWEGMPPSLWVASRAVRRTS